MAGSENGAGATGAGTGAGAGPAGGTVAGYTRFPVVKPVPHLPTMQGLQSGLNYDFPPDFVPSDMWSACASGRWAYVVKELDKDPTVVHKADLSGQTVLHWACLHGANVIAQRVLDMGSSLNVLSGNGQTPFMWAAIQSQLDTMELLRQHNVDMEVHDDNGATALLLAVQHKRPLSLLALLDMGADIDATDNQGCGVAHYAASVGCVEVLRILKHRKYPLNKLDNRGMLPLHRAARSDQGDVVDFLVDNHNDPLLRAEGKTPREMAKEMKNHYVVSRLMRAERRVKKMQGSIIDQVMMHIKSGKERDRWAWCAGWVVNFMGSLIVYWSNLVPATASHTTLSMLFVVCMVVLGVTYPMLTLGNPGKVTEDTPKYPGDRRATRRSRSNHRLDRQSKSEPGDEEAGLIPNRNFVSQLSDGMTGLAKDQRAGFVCFSCELLKPLRSKHCASCDMCVERMDHHCVWINNCVGAGNIRLFNLFCIAQTLAVTVFTFFSCKVVYLLWGHSLGIIHFLRSLLFLYKLMLFHTLINFGGIFMTGMIVYSQWVNMAKNLTTNEEINMMRYEHFWREFQTEDGRRGKRFVNPFSRDRLTNWMEFWGLVDPKTVTTQEIIKIIQDNATLRERDQELFGVDPSAMLSGGGGGGHGHSHGGEGGHGHSHGGDDNHGHSHGGGDDHGHSHSGGDGGHGHSHGGDGGHGHAH